MHTKKSVSFAEFVILMAALMALNAFAIDAILPAIALIATEFGSQNANNAQFIISFIFIGLSLGQLLYGPIADSKGRKSTLLVSLGIFIFGSIISTYASDFNLMLLGRFLQGLGAAGPRIITLAIVRDLYQGRTMAKVMSFVMGIFIFVPAIAPMLGEFILQISNWRGIFMALIIFAVILIFWVSLRQRETLKPENVMKLNFTSVKKAVVETLKHPISLGYTISMGLIYSGFLSYLTTSQQILQIQYELGSNFPFYFGGLALGLGIASIMNAKLVMIFGMKVISRRATMLLILTGLLFLPITIYFDGQPPLFLYVGYLVLVLFGYGLAFNNLSAIAISPLGHIAGTASAVIGSFSTLISIPISVLIGQFYNNTIYPLVIGFLVVSILAFSIMNYLNRYATGD